MLVHSKYLWIGLPIVLGGALFAWYPVTHILRGYSQEDDAAVENERKDDRDREEDQGDVSVIRVSHHADGGAMVHMPLEAQRRIGLVVTTVEATQHRSVVRGYGRLEQDPTSVFTLRSPITGYLESLPRQRSPGRAGGFGRVWPTLGQRLRVGMQVGVVKARLSPMERYDMSSRLVQAHAAIEEARAALAADRSSYENKKKLNADGKVVSDRVLEEAEAKVKGDEARLDAATATAQMLEDAITNRGDRSGAFFLSVGKEGQVVEIFAQPGEAVESGQALLRTTDFRRLWARVEVPVGSRMPEAVSSVQISPIGQEEIVFTAQTWTHAPQINPNTQGRAYLIALKIDDPTLRPGLAVTAYFELAGEPLAGVIIPRSAVVRLGGQAWVYIQEGPERFLRQTISTDTPLASGWFVRQGIAKSDRIVEAAAQELLSEELKAQIELEAEGKEE